MSVQEEKIKPKLAEQEGMQSYIASLKEANETNIKVFQQQLSYIAGGAITITFLFVERFSQSNNSCNWVLYATWSFLVLSLGINLFSSILSAMGHRKVLELIYDNDIEYYKRALRNSKKIKRFIIASLGSLTIGLIMFFVYVGFAL